ncbi:MAG: class II aldolase/adducin family protein [Actinobacteria bacterium]|jgi:ribulose-5-phosphate 4-epimerase/fuculose-1-phosphate aldolase|nr:class II aldolase/adducin family protein [Actinomycetota bacterium]MBT3746999.1 class II aldolase/adducin family protein [Actinomycetota bacterium]MBT3970551.1 class II aldolase/adducin family protein [Actinomycetota bacterium]MBT4010411.1 class II aldolase/adducin family protein [Actinomycetota bacterium]MBT4302808.1 class II aldolase/adducin family protein [Actinomycetota bacterium]
MAIPPGAGSKPYYYEPPSFASVEEERAHRKERLAAAFRIFGKFGFSEGVAGHITVRDPEQTDAFWVNALGQPFSDISVSDLLLVSHTGEILEGNYAVNAAAFAIHSGIHMNCPEVIAAAHSHSLYGKAWSSLGRMLDPITQDACIFYGNHVLFDDYTGVVTDPSEGARIAESLGSSKAAILRNHGLLTVGGSVDEAVWLFVTMERTCQAQLLAEAAGTPVVLDHATAEHTQKYVGNDFSSWFSGQPLFEQILREQPELKN